MGSQDNAQAATEMPMPPSIKKPGVYRLWPPYGPAPLQAGASWLFGSC